MKIRIVFLISAISLFSIFLTSCSNSSGSDGWVPDPNQITITGSLNINHDRPIPPAAKLYVIWEVNSGHPDYIYAFGSGTINTTSKTFTLSFNTAPPVAALSGGYLGVGYVLLLNDTLGEGIHSNRDPKVNDSSTFIGAINDHALIYINGDPQLSTDWVKSFKKGYNLGKGWYNPNPGFDGFEPELAPVQLLVFPDSLKFPNWT